MRTAPAGVNARCHSRYRSTNCAIPGGPARSGGVESSPKPIRSHGMYCAVYAASGVRVHDPVVIRDQVGRMASTAVPAATAAPSPRHRRSRHTRPTTTTASGTAYATAVSGRVIAIQPTATASATRYRSPLPFHHRARHHHPATQRSAVLTSER